MLSRMKRLHRAVSASNMIELNGLYRTADQSLVQIASQSTIPDHVTRKHIRQDQDQNWLIFSEQLKSVAEPVASKSDSFDKDYSKQNEVFVIQSSGKMGINVCNSYMPGQLLNTKHIDRMKMHLTHRPLHYYCRYYTEVGWTKKLWSTLEEGVAKLDRKLENLFGQEQQPIDAKQDMRDEILRKAMEPKPPSKRQMIEGIHEVDSPLYRLMKELDSTKHLFSFISPWIDTNRLSLEDSFNACVFLELLFYNEFTSNTPNMPFLDIHSCCKLLKTIDQVSPVFQDIISTQEFQANCRTLADGLHRLSTSQLLKCLSCLYHVGIPMDHLVMAKGFEIISQIDHEGFSLTDIQHLCEIADDRSFILASVVIPKICNYLSSHPVLSQDANTINALIFVAKTTSVNKIDSLCKDQIHALLKDLCIRTNCLDDVAVASKLAGYAYKEILIAYNEKLVNEQHLQNIKTILHKAVESIEKNSSSLMPHNLVELGDIVRHQPSWLSQNLYNLLHDRALHIIHNCKLTVPQMLWTTVCVDFTKVTDTDIEQKVLTALKTINLPCLLEFFQHFNPQLNQKAKFSDVIAEKLIEYSENIFNSGCGNLVLHFLSDVSFSGLSSSLHHEKDKTIEQCILNSYQHIITEKEQLLIMRFLLNCHEAKPASWELILKLAPRIIHFRNSWSFLKNVQSKLYELSTQPILPSDGLSNSGSLDIRYKAILQVYINITRGLYHNIDLGCRSLKNIKDSGWVLSLGKDPIFIDYWTKMINDPRNVKIDSFNNFRKMYFYLKYLNARYYVYAKPIINSMVHYVEDNAADLKGFMLTDFLNILLCCQFDFTENKNLKDILTKHVYEREIWLNNSNALPAFHKIWNIYNQLGIDLEESLKKIFTIEVLEKFDEIAKECPEKARELTNGLHWLNRVACLYYPHLNVPWFQKQTVSKYNDLFIYKLMGYAPVSFAKAIFNISRGFCGKKIFEVCDIFLWRVLLLSENNTPVTFSMDALNNADSLGLKKFTFWYRKNRAWSTPMQQLFVAQYLGYYKALGYSVIQVHEDEWLSIAHSDMKDKEDLLWEKIINSDKSSEYVPKTVNCEKLSGQWKKYLNTDDL